MKKRTPFLLAAVLFLLVAFCLVQGKRPFRHLQGEDIAEARVTLTPPNVTLLVPDKDRLAALLQDVTLYQQDDSYPEYTGQGVLFTVTLTDGTTTELLAYPPFFVIDGVGYRTKEAPCEACSQYANTLLDDPSLVFLESPPALSVTSNNATIGAYLAKAHWQQAGHALPTLPDQNQDPFPCLDTTATTATLSFTQKPGQILSVRARPLAKTDTAFVSIPISGQEIPLSPGIYLYEVTAYWKEQNGCGGFAVYTFSIQANPAEF